MLQAHAHRICPTHMPDALLNVYATRICTDGRTDERTQTVAHVSHKSSPTDTCTHIQDLVGWVKR